MKGSLKRGNLCNMFFFYVAWFEMRGMVWLVGQGLVPIKNVSGWWFQRLFIFTLTWGDDPF